MRAQGLSRTNERERGGNGGVPQKRCENLIRQKVTHKYTRKRCSGSVPYKKEKSVKKTVEKWSTNCFILYLPHKSKKVLCVSKSPLARWRDAEKRERNRKPDWDWTVCLKRSKCRAFGRMFFIIIIFFYLVRGNETAVVGLFYSKPILPSRKDPPHHTTTTTT